MVSSISRTSHYYVIIMVIFDDIDVIQSKEHKKAEIGFWLLTEFWGQCIMTEVMPIICNYGFDNLGLHRIEGLVEKDNLNCKNAMKKLDFTHEGTMTDCEIKNGKFISLDIYAKFKKD